MKVKVEPTNDVMITFTEEQMEELGIKPGDKFSVDVREDGSISLTPYKSIEIDLNDFDRLTLEMLITISCEEDISINEVISNLLQKVIDAQS